VQWSNISVDFSIKKLTGEETQDFSNKTIGFSVLIPKDSLLDKAGITLSKGDIFVVFNNVGIVENGDTFLQGAWLDYQVHVNEAFRDKSWGYTNGSEAQVKDVIQHCEKISITGARNTAGTAGEAKFYLDDLNWIGFDVLNVPVDNNVDSLRKYAENQHFKFGLWTSGMGIITNNMEGDPWYGYFTAQEGNIATVWQFSAQPNEDYTKFDYDRPVDTQYLLPFYRYAEGNHKTIMGYGIGSISFQAEPWLRNLAFPDATKALLLYHVEKDLQYTKGKNPIWIVFNEQVINVTDSGYGLRNRLARHNDGLIDTSDYSTWNANTSDFTLISAAFRKAREVDPAATLMINDGNNEDLGYARSDYYYKFITDLRDQGVPIDCVGFQLHNWMDPDGTLIVFRRRIPWSFENTQRLDLDTWLKNVDLNVKRYASKGVKVAFTEVDVNIKYGDLDLNTPAGRAEYDKRLQWQAKYYAGLLKIALENENVILYHSWMVTDRYQDIDPNGTAWPGYGNGGILDKHYHPKPAYYAMLDLLKNN
jgi:GH35 family endo-1,4-beta-xylanase